MNSESSFEIVQATPLSVVESITRGEIDVQISTAKKYPRSLSEFKKQALEMVTLDEETAESCLYRRPVGKDDQGKQQFAEGASIRMAEIVAACYGNLRFGSFIVEQTERQVTARGFCHDVEKNVAATSDAIESTVKRDKKPMDERMRVVIAKAALAKAVRDAIFKVVPRGLCKSLADQARAIAIGDAVTLVTRRQKVLEWAAKIGVPNDRVFSALGVKGVEEIGLEQLETLTGLKTAIKEGDVTVPEAFPEIEKPGKQAGPFRSADAAGGQLPGTQGPAGQANEPAGPSGPANPPGAATAPQTAQESPSTPAAQGPAPSENAPQQPKEAAKPTVAELEAKGPGILSLTSEPTDREKLASQIAEKGFTEREVLDACRKNRIKVGASLKTTGDAVVTMLLSDFGTLCDLVVKARGTVPPGP